MLVRPDRVVEGEERWQALGLIGGTVIVIAVHAYREEDARKAAAPERNEEAYEKSR